jgi:putative ATP-dependent endonuclease of the OLD family
VMEKSLGADAYTHFDLMGVSVFDAGADNSVHRHGPIFAALGKLAFGFYDKPNAPLPAEAIKKLASFTQAWESPEKGIENVLVKQTPIAVARRFLEEVQDRADYPSVGTYDPAMSDADTAQLATKVLKARRVMRTDMPASSSPTVNLPRSCPPRSVRFSNLFTPR